MIKLQECRVKIDLVLLTIGGMKMSRSDSVCGLSPRAKKMVAYAKRSLSGEMGQGEYGDDFPLAQFEMPDGRVLRQFVQQVRSCGGSCFFLALKDARGCTVRKSKWTDAQMDECLGIGQDETQDSGVTEEMWLESQREV